MQFLKTLFWVVVAVVAMVFAMRNWVPVTVSLWGGLLIDAKLPVLLYGAFLLGLLPAYAWHRAARWRLERRIESHRRALSDMRDAVPVSPAPLVVPAGPDPAAAATLEPSAQS